MELLQTLVLLTGLTVSIGTIVGCILQYIVIRPLKGSIDSLERVMTEFATSVKDSEKDRRFLFGEIKEVKADINSLWKVVNHEDKDK